MDVKFEPRGGTIETAWELQTLGDSNAEGVASSIASFGATSAALDVAPAAPTESLLPSDTPALKAKSSPLEENNEYVNNVDTSTPIGDSMSAEPNPSALLLRIHDAPSISNTTQSNEQPEGLGPLFSVGTLAKDGLPFREVELLETNHWIRSRTHHASSNLQIYVDPRLTHRNNIQRSIKDLRAAFKVLMAKIDPSPEAWEGRRNATNSDTLSNGEDDESLWYIFNTLQDPNPQVDLVKDGPSRKAMSYLLSDEDFSEYGLKTPLYPYQRRSAAMMVQREVQPARMLDPRLQACASPTGLKYYYDKEDGWITLEKYMYDEAVGGRPYSTTTFNEHN